MLKMATLKTTQRQTPTNKMRKTALAWDDNLVKARQCPQSKRKIREAMAKKSLLCFGSFIFPYLFCYLFLLLYAKNGCSKRCHNYDHTLQNYADSNHKERRSKQRKLKD